MFAPVPLRARILVVVCLGLAAAGCASSGGSSAPPTSLSAGSPTTTGSGNNSSTTGPGNSPSTTIPGGIDGQETSKLPDLPSATRPPVLPNPSTSTGQQQFIQSVFNDVQSTWSQAFSRSGLAYTPARLQLFTSSVNTACGAQEAEVGPFYCPADRTVYMDLRFFAVLQQQFGAGGTDFAQAYVVAHEVGHHLQNVLGISTRVAAAEHVNPALSNPLSVRVELQADCFAGVWAHSAYTRNLLQPGDIQDALNAAAVVGDDFIQQLHNGQIEPDNWTHGSSAQRQHWLTVGYDTGNANACDTFSTTSI